MRGANIAQPGVLYEHAGIALADEEGRSEIEAGLDGSRRIGLRFNHVFHRPVSLCFTGWHRYKATG
ncbi:MAG: hypothetical protein QXS54_01420 [Candidatus Methanomethylicaceae archaeon]